MRYKFFKMHAQGNDYIYFDFTETVVPDLNFSEAAIKLSDRHYGIGADGIVLIQSDERCDAFMRIFNADGSEAEMCGSALRCTAYYLNKQHKVKSSTINTKSGEMSIAVEANSIVKVSLGKAELLSNESINIAGYEGFPVNIGNPHFVCFTKVLNPQATSRFGPLIENHEKFLNKTNVEFVHILSQNKIALEVWERGSGRTLACGTGAGASVFAGIKKGFLDNIVQVDLPGGSVTIEMKDDEIFLSGEVNFVFSGIAEV
jgi:diaminopimelate epimerase